jgi:hypothetical protein
VVLSATHTHSGPAGFLQYVLFEVSSLGFIEQTFNAMVDGIARVSMYGFFDSYILEYLINAHSAFINFNIFFALCALI